MDSDASMGLDVTSIRARPSSLQGHYSSDQSLRGLHKPQASGLGYLLLNWVVLPIGLCLVTDYLAEPVGPPPVRTFSLSLTYGNRVMQAFSHRGRCECLAVAVVWPTWSGNVYNF